MAAGRLPDKRCRSGLAADAYAPGEHTGCSRPDQDVAHGLVDCGAGAKRSLRSIHALESTTTAIRWHGHQQLSLSTLITMKRCFLRSCLRCDTGHCVLTHSFGRGKTRNGKEIRARPPVGRGIAASLAGVRNHVSRRQPLRAQGGDGLVANKHDVTYTLASAPNKGSAKQVFPKLDEWLRPAGAFAQAGEGCVTSPGRGTPRSPGRIPAGSWPDRGDAEGRGCPLHCHHIKGGRARHLYEKVYCARGQAKSDQTAQNPAGIGPDQLPFAAGQQMRLICIPRLLADARSRQPSRVASRRPVGKFSPFGCDC